MSVNGWRFKARSFGSVVCLSTADWNAPLWTNKQHLMSRVATELPVVYVESLGLRAPRLTRHDVCRITRRVRLRQPHDHAASPRVVSPIVIPWHRHRAVRRLNRTLLARQLPHPGSLPRPCLLWTYAPLAADEIDLESFDQVVYHCVDDLASVPRVQPALVRELEGRLAPRATAVFASTPALTRRLTAFNPQTVYLPNAVDSGHFGQALVAGPIPEDLARIPEPRALYIGSLSDHKLDWRLVTSVADRLPHWSFVFIGPVGAEHAMSGWRTAKDRANCHLLGLRSYEQLPAYLRGAQAGVVPYLRSEHTAGVFPLKALEYLAAGVALVATPLESLASIPRLPASFASDADAFARALEQSDASLDARSQRAYIAAARSWERNLEQIFSTLAGAP